MEIVPLRRLLNRRSVVELLTQAVQIIPGLAMALVENDGRVFAEAGNRPDGGEAQTLPVIVEGETFGALLAWGLESADGGGALLGMVRMSVEQWLSRALENRSLAQEMLERYREINLLYNIGESISSSLDPDAIPPLVLAEAIRIIHVDVGVVLLHSETGELVTRLGFGGENLEKALEATAEPIFPAVLTDGRPRILNADSIPVEASSEVAMILCAPLKTRERIIGFVLLGRGPGQPIFTASDEKLLVALAGQAAVAVENARLFADVKRQRDAMAEIKNYMDNIFASIASGVITTDVKDLITIVNRAAERILGVEAATTMGMHYREALPELSRHICQLVETVKEQDQSVVGYELQSVLPGRGPVVLQVHLSPLKDNHEQTTGIAIVVDDLTEQRQLEEQVRTVRRTFERYVAPRVVAQLLSDPTRVQLGGVRQEVTILFADIRGFTSFSEKMAPEMLVEILNRYLTLAADAVLAQDGTLDKFIGDAVMAIFNAPLSQTDHTLRAVRAALTMQRQIAAMNIHMPPSERLGFGIGIVTGPAVVGNVGSTVLQNYTAIGDGVNLASRLQNHAVAGQILMNPTAYDRVRDQVIARELGLIKLKGHSEPDLVFEMLGLRE